MSWKQPRREEIDLKTLIHVEIGWLDAAVDTQFDGKPVDFPQKSESFLRSSGFLFEFTSKRAILVRDIEDETNTMRWTQTIPRPYIEYIRKSNTDEFIYRRKKRVKANANDKCEPNNSNE